MQKAGDLREQGYLARAARALDDAETRCPAEAKSLVETARSLVKQARSVRDDETATGILNDPPKSADPAIERRRKERWLAALDRDAGAATRVSAPDPAIRRSFSWAPDGSRGALLQGGELSIYDPELRAEQQRYSLGEGSFEVLWLPSAKGLVAVNRLAGGHRILDLERRKAGPIAAVGEAAFTVAISRDGKTLVWAGTKIRFLDLATTKEIGALATDDPFVGVGWSPAGDKVALGFGDGRVRVLSFPSLRPVSSLQDQLEPATPLFLSDDRLLVVQPGHVALHEVATGKTVGKPSMDEHCLALPLDDGTPSVLRVCSEYQTIHVEDVRTGKSRTLYARPEDAPYHPGFEMFSVSPGGATVWLGWPGEQHLLDVKTGNEIATLRAQGATEMSIRPDGKRLAAVEFDGARLWTSDLHGDERQVTGFVPESSTCEILGADALGAPLFVEIVPPPDGFPAEATVSVRGAGFEPRASRKMPVEACPFGRTEDASRVVLLGKREEVRLVRLDGGVIEAAVPIARIGSSERAAVSGDGAVLAVWGNAGARLIEIGTKRPLGQWKGPVDLGAQVAVSRSGERMLAFGAGESILFEAGTSEPSKLPALRAPVAFAGDDLLASATVKAVQIRDLRTGATREAPSILAPSRMAIAPDGRRAVVAGPSETAIVDLAGGKDPVSLPRIDETEQIVFFAGGRVIAAFEPRLGVTRLFSTSSGARLGELRRTGHEGAVYLSATGNVEVFGGAAAPLACVREPSLLPFEDCVDRYVETGLLARAFAGRGCTTEDVGDVCE